MLTQQEKRDRPRIDAESLNLPSGRGSSRPASPSASSASSPGVPKQSEVLQSFFQSREFLLCHSALAAGWATDSFCNPHSTQGQTRRECVGQKLPVYTKTERHTWARFAKSLWFVLSLMWRTRHVALNANWPEMKSLCIASPVPNSRWQGDPGLTMSVPWEEQERTCAQYRDS